MENHTKIFGVVIDIGRKDEITDPQDKLPGKGNAVNLVLIFGSSEGSASSYHCTNQYGRIALKDLPYFQWVLNLFEPLTALEINEAYGPS